jgi:hypothetical protein
MTTLTLERYCYSETETEGWLWLDDGTRLHTLERPWRAGPPGGMPFVSCVPDGTYELVPHQRPNGDLVLALRNPDLGVYYEQADVPDAGGRYLILIHPANFVHQINGCLAPGKGRTIHNGQPMVTSSRQAMQEIMQDNYDALEIECVCGAS